MGLFSKKSGDRSGPTPRAFISHSSKDRPLANRLCSLLEKDGVSCWIAPRDVIPGAAYGAQIVRAIEKADAVVVVLSKDSNKSRHVESEVARGFEKGKAIYPVRVEDVWPSEGLELFVTSAHWVEAVDRGIGKAAKELASSLIDLPKRTKRERAAGAGRGRRGSKAVTGCLWMAFLLVLAVCVGYLVFLFALVREQGEQAEQDEQGEPRAAQPAEMRERALAPVEHALARYHKFFRHSDAADMAARPVTTGAVAGTEATPQETPVPDLAASEPPQALSELEVRKKEGGVWQVGAPPMAFVWVEALGLWVGKCEVTNGEYREFRKDHFSGRYGGEPLDGDTQPVVSVSRAEARAFADWLTGKQREAGKLPGGWGFRLPSAREWAACARCGSDRRYPWGDEWPPKHGNYADVTLKVTFREAKGINDYIDGYTATCPVAGGKPNEWGLHDMGGNVWEWTTDALDSNALVCGGAWDCATPEQLACEATAAFPPSTKRATIGFRLVLARDAE